MDTLVTDKPIGIFPLENKKGIGFRVWAPNARAVSVIGEFNKWKANKKSEMTREEDGHWFIEISNAKNGHAYKFQIETADGEVLTKNDPRARLLENSVGNSIIYLDEFDWKEDDFEIANWNELVIYEMHIGTFNVKGRGKHKKGTFKSAAEKLPDLQKMGINAVELLPINEFAGDTSWGYNPAHPYAIESAYGHPDDFKNFVKTAHEHGIAVILDVVYNHFGPSDVDMWQFDGWSENDGGGIYFYNDWRAETPWGDTRPDYGRKEVQDYIVENAMLWLNEYRCDGLRLDAVSYIRNVKGGNHNGDFLQEGFELSKKITEKANELFPKKIIIAEDTADGDIATADRIHNGMGFGACWDVEFSHKVRETVQKQKDEYRDLNQIVSALLNEYDGDPFKRVVYSESHDEVANGKQRIAEQVKNGENVDNFYSKKLASIANVILMTTAGIPMLFQGQEILEDKWFSDTDPLDWSRKKKFCGIYNLHKDLIHLRRNAGGITNGLLGRHTEIIHFNTQNKVMAYVRYVDEAASGAVVVILNLSNEAFPEYYLPMPNNKEWKIIFNSDWKGYDEDFGDFTGAVFNERDDNGKVKVALGAYSGIVLVEA